MPASKPFCETLLPWLRANLGKQCLAPLTSQDSKALAAAVQTVALYAYSDERHEPALLEAFAAIVMCMQPHTRELAYHAIAHVRDWHSREEMWQQAGLPPIERMRCCAHEPRASRPYPEAAAA